MTGYFPLLRLQFLSRFADLKPRNIKANFQAHRGKTVGMAIAYVIAFAYLGAFLVFSEYYILDSLMEIGIPDLLLSMAVTMAMLSTLILAFFFIMSSLYFSRDTAFIAALPVTPRTVLAAKLTQIWLSETGISGLFILPACILYAIRVGVDALFYLRMLLVWAGVAVLPVVIVTLLSTLLIRLSFLWKRREIVATVGGIALMVGYMIFVMNMSSTFSGDDSTNFLIQFFTNNRARIESMTRIFPPAGWAAEGLLGDWGRLLLFLAVSAGAMALTVWLVGYIYRDLSLLQSETPADTKKKARSASDSYQGGSAFRACVVREIRQILRVPAYATNTLPTAFMPVLLTVMFAVTMNRSMGAEGESFEMLLDGLGGGVLVAGIAALLAFMSGINPAIATAVSREGRGHAFLTALPIPPRTSILAKMAVGYGMSFIGCLVAAVILMVMVPALTLYVVLGFILAALFCYAVGAITLSRDIAHPKLDWLTEQEAIKQSAGALIGLLVSWGLLVTLGILSFFLLRWELGPWAYFGCMAALLLVILALSHMALMKAADKQYCQTE